MSDPFEIFLFIINLLVPDKLHKTLHDCISQEERSALEERCRVLDSELQDLRCMSQYEQKRMKEERVEFDKKHEVATTELANLQTKVWILVLI